MDINKAALKIDEYVTEIYNIDSEIRNYYTYIVFGSSMSIEEIKDSAFNAGKRYSELNDLFKNICSKLTKEQSGMLINDISIFNSTLNEAEKNLEELNFEISIKLNQI